METSADVKRNFPELPEELCELIVKSTFFNKYGGLRRIKNDPHICSLLLHYKPRVWESYELKILQELLTIYGDNVAEPVNEELRIVQYGGVSLDIPLSIYNDIQSTWIDEEFIVKIYLNSSFRYDCLESSFYATNLMDIDNSISLLKLHAYMSEKCSTTNSLNIPDSIYSDLINAGFKHEDVERFIADTSNISKIRELFNLEAFQDRYNKIKAIQCSDADHIARVKTRGNTVQILSNQLKVLDALEAHINSSKPKTKEVKLSRRFQ